MLEIILNQLSSFDNWIDLSNYLFNQENGLLAEKEDRESFVKTKEYKLIQEILNAKRLNQDFNFLTGEELHDVLEHKGNKLFIGGIVDKHQRYITIWDNDLNQIVVTFDIFQPSGTGLKPDFDKFSIVDYGHGIALGEYEASNEACRYEALVTCVPDFFQDESNESLRKKILWINKNLGLDDDFLIKLLDSDKESIQIWKKDIQFKLSNEYLVQDLWIMVLHFLSHYNNDIDVVYKLFNEVTTLHANCSTDPDNLVGTPGMIPWINFSLKSYLENDKAIAISKTNEWLMNLRFGNYQ